MVKIYSVFTLKKKQDGCFEYYVLGQELESFNSIEDAEEYIDEYTDNSTRTLTIIPTYWNTKYIKI